MPNLLLYLLKFRGIEVSDAGRYVCQATNIGGMSESVAEVRVNTSPLPAPSHSGPPHSSSIPIFPRQSRRELTGVVGQTLEIRCNVRATSAPTWTKDGLPPPRSHMMFGPMLTILNLQLNDAGTYICETADTSEVIDLSVEGMVKA